MGLEVRDSLVMSNEEFRNEIDTMMRTNKDLAEKIIV